MSTSIYLDFEQPIETLENKLKELESSKNDSPERHDEIRNVRKQLADTIREIYGDLSPWQTVEVARHQKRPQSADYLNLVFDEFVELHGDRKFGDDRALRTGFAKLDKHKVMFIGHFKGRDLKERSECFFGCAHPEGYRKAIEKMQLAEKYNLPVITFIDTPGAYPGVGAEERGQAMAIADAMFVMSRLKTPIISVVIGEGGSGGALGIGVADRTAMLQHAYYSVISPEGCAGILWKSHEFKAKAAEALKFTSKYLPKFGIVDDVIEEPLGGAHRDHHQMAARLKMYLTKTVNELVAKPTDELVEGRYDKFRQMGVYLEREMEATEGEPAS
ncbi:acetyl-CoA carboxylase carboxyltransferase subunit alpha [Blastopirellula marina]|uniref:Acetyl-coenzyme A carboxylase carboxyl transferase subunit alpha n=1 Tax=Blastopirellula marina TaxID=124 RepID=A0A2S8GE98_9BACT|nr:acetyl-CoA carboxylase carboxyltransferase subunit alpha [Blastopirellula marina]PQO42776.1 acetyl-CoA carboxylase carboxyl transferase subunit alpha [Blastopirellula marina]PTL46542.1 acetyl-CoA carboxylase carboxyltransferase subunit alpha [Blastopirellula marina]